MFEGGKGMPQFGRLLLVAVGLFSAAPALAQSSPSSFTTGYRYDAARRLTGTIDPDPDGAGPLHYAAIRNTYTNGLLTKVEKGELSSWQAETIAPASWSGFTVFQTVTTAYDGMGRKIQDTVTGSDGKTTVTQYTYDVRGRLMCSAERMNSAVFSSLPTSACNLSTQGADGPDRITYNTYDAADQLAQVQKGFWTSAQINYATYTYTPNGKQKDVTDANGNMSEFTYDGFDRLSKWTFPSKTTAGALSTTDFESYTYDINSNRASLQKRDGRIIRYWYDGLDRVVTKCAVATVTSPCVVANATTGRDVYYNYDVLGHQLTARFDSSSGSDGITNGYNGFGELTSATISMSGFTKTLTSTYDCNGNRIQLSHPESGYTFAYSYDGLDRLGGLTQGTATNTSCATTTVAGTALDGFTYNNQQLVSARTEGTTGASNVSYGWDKLDRLTSQSDGFSGGTGNVAWTLAYNSGSQLNSDQISNDSYAFTTGQIGSVNRNYTVNGLNQYSAAGTTSFTYDNNANLITDGTWTYTYDIENRLVKAVAGGITTNLTYDPMGRLFQVDQGTSGTTTKFIYDGDAMVLEYNGSNLVANRYVHGNNAAADDPLFWYAGSDLSAAHWLHADHLGSIVAITNSSGVNSTINSYDEYGINGTGNSTSERFGYTGQAYEPQLNLYYYKARFYSPNLGRFLQTDPIGYKDQINLYAYVGNDPVDATDPSGNEGIGPQEGSGGSSADDDANRKHVEFCKYHPDFCGGYTEMMSGLHWMAQHPKTTIAGAVVGVGVGVCFATGPCDLAAIFGGAVEGGEILLEGTEGAEAAAARGATEDAANAANPFKGKTPEQIDKILREKGFEPRGPDPVNGKGGYVNLKTGRSFHIDEANRFGEEPHVDVNRPKNYQGPLEKKKLPM